MLFTLQYYNPVESGVVGASMDGRARWSEPASVPLESFWKNQNLPVTKDVSDEIDQVGSPVLTPD